LAIFIWPALTPISTCPQSPLPTRLEPLQTRRHCSDSICQEDLLYYEVGWLVGLVLLGVGMEMETPPSE